MDTNTSTFNPLLNGTLYEDITRVRACVRACVRVCVCVCVRAWVPACVLHACVSRLLQTSYQRLVQSLD